MKTTNPGGSYILSALLTLAFLASPVSNAQAQQASSPHTETFQWSAELAALDTATPAVTVKARVPNDEAAPAFEHLKSGERIVLTWSGIDKFSDGIRSVAPYDAHKETTGHMMFPAEFLSFDATRHIATIKVPIPPADVPKIQSLKPGDWITATSPHGKPAATQPVSSIRPYVWSAEKP